MKFTNELKNEVRDALSAYRDNYGGTNRAAESLSGVSAATISQILNSKYTNISDDMFTRIAMQIGFNFDKWQIHESTAFREITFAMSDAQLYKCCTWVVGDAGCGKSTAGIAYRRTHKHVFYILCSEDMRRGDFVREIAKQVGAPTDSTNLRDILEYAIQMIQFLNNPLLIFDEADKLTDGVFTYFISIYNRLENRAGIIFLSTSHIKRRMETGLRYNKKGYQEVDSRIGRRFFEVDAITQNDIHAICRANDLTDETEIKKVISDAATAKFDLRRVKRKIHACKRAMENRKKEDNNGE